MDCLCALHLQLFKLLGFRPVKYAHIAPILKEENGGKRKLSKRKDPKRPLPTTTKWYFCGSGQRIYDDHCQLQL